MSARTISQREARRLRKRVVELEQAYRTRLNRWNSDWPGGIRLETVQGEAVGLAKLDVAMRLGCVVVVKLAGDNFIYYAVKP